MMQTEGLVKVQQAYAARGLNCCNESSLRESLISSSAV